MAKKQSSILDKPAILQRPDFKKKARRPARSAQKPVKASELPTEDKVPETVQGKKVGSKQEGRVAVALSVLGWDFEFQVPVMGGHLRRGGQVIDFLVRTRPLPTPLFIEGTYWHTGTHADPFDAQRINAAYAGWKYAQVVKIPDNELPTIAAAVTVLRKELPHS